MPQTVLPDGSSRFTPVAGGKHRFLVLKDDQKLRTLETMILLASPWIRRKERDPSVGAKRRLELRPWKRPADSGSQPSRLRGNVDATQMSSAALSHHEIIGDDGVDSCYEVEVEVEVMEGL